MAHRGFSFGFGLSPWVQRLIIINVAMLLATSMVDGLQEVLAFVPSLRVLMRRPWTPFTYMFLHGDFLHLFLNMLGLFFFGPPLEARWGSAEFLKYYLLCGLGGAALYFVLSPMGPAAAVVGASGAVFGIILAFSL